MRTIKGPGVFLAQFAADEAPYDSLAGLAGWAAQKGFKGVQIPTWDTRLIDMAKAAESDAYCDEIKGLLADNGLQITEFASHITGQLVAVHPAYKELFASFAPPEVGADVAKMSAWGTEQVKMAAKASQKMGFDRSVSFSGSLLWPYMYPWPQRPEPLVEEGFAELCRRWKPILDVYEDCGVDVCYEIHPGEDLHDGATFERFLEGVDGHTRANILFDPSHFVLQQLDYVDFIHRYHDRIRMFHVKDAEFRPNGRCGVYGGYLPWAERAGRFRSTGDGQVDFKQIFSALTHYGFDGWAVVEWECAMKDPMQGARESAAFVRDHLIKKTAKAFDDFAGTGSLDTRGILGLD